VKLQFLGATRQVTGSQYYVQADGARILVDCGMYQEREFLARNWEPSPLRPGKIDALLLSHAHLDHCGLAPKLVGEGFRGPIVATAASADLVELVLRDSAKIQAEDAAYKKRRHKREGRKGKYPVKPLYTPKDVSRTLKLLQPAGYEQPVEICPGVSAVFHDAGHILGSAMIELSVRSGDRTRRLIFSGDVGQWGKPIVRDPTAVAEADLIVMESTYGDRDHEDPGNVESQLAQVINRTVEQGGNVVIPVFAIERAQELIYHVSRLRHAGQIPELSVFLDSPMAADVTAIFRRHRECFDLEAWQLITSGESPLSFPGLTLTRSVDESKAINDHPRPAIIMSTSGMCTAGRIKFHLRQNIGRPESTILFVGYQARGTLGRRILEGQPEVRIHGRPYRVKARVEQIQGFSGHADRSALMRWLGYFQTPPERLFLTGKSACRSIGRWPGWAKARRPLPAERCFTLRLSRGLWYHRLRCRCLSLRR
jgi:metallo-beta-lactamase family protein